MLQKNKSPSRHTLAKRVLFILCAWICAHAIYITIDGERNYKGRADVVIILGNTVFADGQLSDWLRGRVDAALQLYKEGRVKKIFASGGISKNKEGDYPEGDAMKQYLVSKGVPAADVIADNAGQNTYLTAIDFISWNKDYHFTSAIVASQFYHITRSKFILRKLGFKNVYGVCSRKYSFSDIFGTLREVPAFYKYLLIY